MVTRYRVLRRPFKMSQDVYPGTDRTFSDFLTAEIRGKMGNVRGCRTIPAIRCA
jgi:hypothetical protein